MCEVTGSIPVRSTKGKKLPCGKFLPFVETAAMFCEHAKPRGAGCENFERRREIIRSHKIKGHVAKLVDALCSERSESNLMRVQISPCPQSNSWKNRFNGNC